MDTLRWIIIGVAVAGIIGFALIKFFYKRYQITDKRVTGINKKTKCWVENCETWYKDKEQKHCTFHAKVSALYEQLKKHKSPLANKAKMYMSASARFYNDSSQMGSALKELEQELSKYEKK